MKSPILTALMLFVLGALTPGVGQAQTVERGGFAAVDAAGQVVYGSGVRRAEIIGLGSYAVKFRTSVRNCAYIASAGSPTAGGTGPDSLSFFTRRSAASGKTVEVFIFDNEIAQRDLASFFLLVQC